MREIRSPLDGIWSPFPVFRGIALSGARSLVRFEDEALSLDFLDNYFLNTTSFYGSAWIKDTGTPANDYDTAPVTTASSLLTYTSPSAKMIRHADGLYKFAAHNTTVYSEDISNGAWTKIGTTAASASSLVENSATSSHQLQLPSRSAVSGKKYVVEVDVSAAGRTNFMLYGLNLASSGVGFSLSGAGSTFTVPGIPNTGTGTIEEVSAGRYRCRVIFTSITTGTAGGYGSIYILNDAKAVSYAGDGTSGIVVHRVHTYDYPADQTYLKTTSAARYALPIEFDSSGNPLGLLVEEARTNLCLWSDDLTNAAWVKTNATAAKTATGPDGVANSASTLTATADNAGVFQRISSVSSSAARSIGVHLKRRTGTGAVTIATGETTGSNLITNGTFDSDVSGWTNFGGGTITHNGAGGATVTGSAATGTGAYTAFTPTLGKLYRMAITVTLGTATVVEVQVGDLPTGGGLALGDSYAYIVASGTYERYFICTDTTVSLTVISRGAGNTCTIDNVSVLEVVESTVDLSSGEWVRATIENKTLTNPTVAVKLATSGDAVDVALAGLEAGAFVTSPIPTFGATATRAVDNISWVDTGTLINANGGVGTLYVKSQITRYALNTTLVSLNNSSSGEQSRQEIYLSSTTSVLTIGRDASGSSTHAMNVGSLSAVPGPRKAALAFATNDFSMYVNGSASTPDTLGAVGTNANKIWVGRNYAGTNGHQHIQQIMYLPRRVSNADLQTLTGTGVLPPYVPPSGPVNGIQLETGDYLLTEAGDYLVQEA